MHATSMLLCMFIIWYTIIFFVNTHRDRGGWGVRVLGWERGRVDGNRGRESDMAGA